MGMIKHSQITQSIKFAISLQYLKKEVRNGGHFWHADRRQSFYKLLLSFLMEVTRHVQKAQNRKLEIFLQNIEKNCCNCFVLQLLGYKTFTYFTGGQSCSLLLLPSKTAQVLKNLMLILHKTKTR